MVLHVDVEDVILNRLNPFLAVFLARDEPIGGLVDDSEVVAAHGLEHSQGARDGFKRTGVVRLVGQPNVALLGFVTGLLGPFDVLVLLHADADQVRAKWNRQGRGRA